MARRKSIHVRVTVPEDYDPADGITFEGPSWVDETHATEILQAVYAMLWDQQHPGTMQNRFVLRTDDT